MKRHVLILVTIISFSLLFLSSTNAKSKQIDLRFNYNLPAKYSVAYGWEWFGSELEKRSDGRVKFISFPHGALFSTRQCVENIIAGTADMAMLSLRSYAKAMPLMTIFFLPTVVFPDNLEGTIAAANSMMTLHREFPELQKETKNFKLLWNSTLAPYFLVTKRSLKVPIDLNGMKIGAGGIQGDFATINGGSGVAISPPKSYMSLKTGLLDGMALSWSALAVYKIWEVAPHLNTVDVGRVHLPVMMNKDYWNSLPPDMQDLVEKLAVEQVTVGTKRLYEDTVKGRKRAIENGMQVYTPSGKEEPTWNAAFQKLENQWLSDRLAEGHTVAPKLLERYKQIAAEANK